VFTGGASGEMLVDDDASIERIMRSGRRRIAFHSEDEPRIRERRNLFKTGDPHRLHMSWRDEECAFLGTRRLMALARKTGRLAHILHVSTAEELGYLRDFRDLATAEVLVNNLTQIGPECYDRLAGYAVMNPPIRDRRHFEASWAAVREGMVDTISSDHAPYSKAAKDLPWPDCPGGLTGVQTLVPIMLDHVNAGRLSLPRLADLVSAGPARVYGLAGKGRIALGYDADFTLVDMERKHVIEPTWIASPCGWSPFSGVSVKGWPIYTVVRGNTAMAEDEVIGTPSGSLARFQGEAVSLLPRSERN
jgi:dihydroorotase